MRSGSGCAAGVTRRGAPSSSPPMESVSARPPVPRAAQMSHSAMLRMGSSAWAGICSWAAGASLSMAFCGSAKVQVMKSRSRARVMAT